MLLSWKSLGLSIPFSFTKIRAVYFIKTVHSGCSCLICHLLVMAFFLSWVIFGLYSWSTKTRRVDPSFTLTGLLFRTLGAWNKIVFAFSQWRNVTIIGHGVSLLGSLTAGERWARSIFTFSMLKYFNRIEFINILQLLHDAFSSVPSGIPRKTNVFLLNLPCKSSTVALSAFVNLGQLFLQSKFIDQLPYLKLSVVGD